MTSVARDTNVFTDAWNAIYGKLSSISDPGGKSKWIYSAFPESEIDKKQAYPLIVISPIEVSADRVTFNGVKSGPLRVIIDIYSTKASELDSLSDQVTETLINNEKNLVVSGVYGLRLVSSAYSNYSRNALRIHNKSLNYEFTYVWYP